MSGLPEPTVTVSIREHAVVISVVGDLSAAEVPALDTAIIDATERRTTVLVDLSAVRLIDATIARTLHASASRCTQIGLPFAAVGATGQPERVLEVLGLAKDLGAYLSLAEALETLPFTEVPPERMSLDRYVHDVLAAATAPGLRPARVRALQQQATEVALPLARTMARRYRQRGEPMEDLVQVASVGLVRAVRGYDPARGSGFLAYAVPTILGELRRHFRDHCWTVRPPRTIQEVRVAAGAVWSDLAQSLGRAPDVEDLAGELGVADDAVVEAIRSGSGRTPTSLDAPISDGTEQTLHDIIGTDSRDIDLVELRATLRPAIASLSDVAREVLTLRLTTDLTQAEIGRRLGMSQMGVSRSLTATFAHLRRAVFADPEDPAA